MSHARKQLRDAVRAALVTDLSGTVGKIVGVRTYAWNTTDLPAIEVSTPGETVQRQSDDGDIRRDIALLVTVYDAAHEGIEDEVDAIGELVEASVYGVAESAPWQAGILGIETEFDPGDGGEKRPASLRMVFTVMVFATEAAPTVLT